MKPPNAMRIRLLAVLIMERINRLHAHISAASTSSSSSTDVFVSPRDASCPQNVYDAVLSPAALEFVAELAATFQHEVEQLHARRQARRLATEQNGAMPHFLEETRAIREDETWRVDPQPNALMDRRVDIGDVSPANRKFLLRALNSGAQGVQVDFDDGHCPTWSNTLQGHFNVLQAARGLLEVSGQTTVANPALLVIRPRAWNMDEPHMVVNGRVVPGALFDFGMHLFHNGKHLLNNGTGPFLYLPKLEGYKEAALWRRIFEYTEKKLEFARGRIKATVLIENIFAAFEMDEILFELRHYSSGLNCGMWDYTASIVVNFRHRPAFLLPDRQQFVSMKSDFLRYYMDLLIATCKRRHAPATTGMVPFVLAELPPGFSQAEAIEKTRTGKTMEALAGSDGALVYDLALVKPGAEVFTSARERTTKAGFSYVAVDERLFTEKLLTLPKGDVTLQSVEMNVHVALLYVLHWLYGQGTVVVNGCVEDSATAEISRAQLWQWVHHRVTITGTPQQINASLIGKILRKLCHEENRDQRHPPQYMEVAQHLVLLLSTMRSPPAFITTFLQEQEALTKALNTTK
ncbi:malate synthase A, variant 1 [Phytophthora nicotianae CJ01A1]|uniref:malate synthase n=7 Tax=Phytophthora nicotianae TaxID=4792 RepID=V9FJ52_PHYNI|nr:malate synthase A [Phytophthora nicotianae INRA-310]XP_008891447.1 malate synthase A, variant 1 [Phytophthora nicotianae INRA-310]ETI50407.1 malate synthase A [Phytophthora nicotianae P1569]ETK90284.1 malate synthase A [Phytophthora nicotianae]ETO79142.1 malate synthase A [Phytophthora nicotianae P1976]ETP20170.1 malate synthase A [Phytophthora nicotianae CJ01A1]ETP48138.1 malate synthase A [Phytophthora nicotianae P10297]